jgi:hypothetical protein
MDRCPAGPHKTIWRAAYSQRATTWIALVWTMENTSGNFPRNYNVCFEEMSLNGFANRQIVAEISSFV